MSRGALVGLFMKRRVGISKSSSISLIDKLGLMRASHTRAEFCQEDRSWIRVTSLNNLVGLDCASIHMDEAFFSGIDHAYGYTRVRTCQNVGW